MSLRALSALFSITASLAAPPTHAETTGSLHFIGLVNGGTCNLAAGDVNRTVTLPTVKVSDFESTDFAGALTFEISADCESDVSTVTFLFAGTPATGNAAMFANTGTAGGTALWLQHQGIADIPANGTPAKRSRTIATSANKAVLPLRAAYHKTGAAITQGTLATAVTVSITYN
ncbi:pilus assembly protein [Pseudomonas sp. S35]|uniref:fimbrial protein n=1 Tax=Pseudomonas sp. S35 TaxID=1573719 RepID=UPI00132EC2D4|nr:fimbrial protein [Pseudomonas sp. S35]QHF42601.1 pilus assembly protein [Pseudomonas sp. S35]